MEQLEAVAPVRPAAAWVGGKRNLAKRLIARINAVPHDTYAEAFVGMGGVFLRRDMRPKCEVINDASEDVANLFRILQHHYIAFVEMIRFQISSRANFDLVAAGSRYADRSAPGRTVPLSAASGLWREGGRRPDLRRVARPRRAV